MITDLISLNRSHILFNELVSFGNGRWLIFISWHCFSHFFNAWFDIRQRGVGQSYIPTQLALILCWAGRVNFANNLVIAVASRHCNKTYHSRHGNILIWSGKCICKQETVSGSDPWFWLCFKRTGLELARGNLIRVNCYCWGNSSMVEGRFSKWF